MDWTTAFDLIYKLFVNYTFGSLELAYAGSFLLVAMIAYKLHVSADGWVLVLGGYGAVAGWLFLPSLAMPSLVAVVLGLLLYFLLKRLMR
jgi:hypothetical protein